MEIAEALRKRWKLQTIRKLRTMRSKERLLHEHNKRFSLNTLLHPRRFRLIPVRVAPLNHESLRCHRSRCWLEQDRDSSYSA